MAWTTPKTDFANGDVLTAAEMNAVGNDLAYLYALPAAPSFVAGKNKVLNGDFGIWQRGTTFAPPATIYQANTADRWNALRAGFATGYTVSRQSSALTGIQYAARIQRDSGNSSTAQIFLSQTFETAASIPLVGQQVTISAYVRAGTNYSSSGNALSIGVASGTGTDQNLQTGFTGYVAVINQVATLTTAWQRVTFTGTVPTNSTQLGINIYYTPTGTAGANDYFEITGVQLEAGSVATSFTTATGNPASELAACQRYYWRMTSDASNAYSRFITATATTATAGEGIIQFPSTMRTSPSAIDYANIHFINYGSTGYTISSVSLLLNNQSASVATVYFASSGMTAGQFGWIRANNSTSAYIGFSAEL